MGALCRFEKNVKHCDASPQCHWSFIYAANLGYSQISRSKHLDRMAMRVRRNDSGACTGRLGACNNANTVDGQPRQVGSVVFDPKADQIRATDQC